MTEISSIRHPPRLLSDANLNRHIITGLRRLQPGIDVITAQSLGAAGLSDSELIERARQLDRIILTHDRRTMSMHLAAFLNALRPGEYSPGIISVAQTLPIGAAIEAILLIWTCSDHEEWRDQFVFLPL